MTDPVFETWAEVEAWREAEIDRCRRHIEAVLGIDETAAVFRTDALIRRVIAAHSHLREIR